MRRYLFVALMIGAVAVLTVAMLHQFDLMRGPISQLASFYRRHGFTRMEAGGVSGTMSWVTFILAGFGIAWVMVDVPKVIHKCIIALGFLTLVMSLSAVCALFGFFYEPFSTLMTGTLAGVLGLIFSSTEAGSRKKVLQTVLGGRVSDKTFRALLNGPRPAFLDGEHREISILTVRVFNHVELRGAVAPADLVEMTNLFLQNSGEFLASRGGFLDESSPDCVRVYFGLVRKDPDHCLAACEAALELRQRLSNLNVTLEARFFQRLAYGIAVSADEMTLGVYQSENQARLSAVGEVIEHVRKLSAANAIYGSRILLAASTYTLIRDHYAVRPMEMILDTRTDLMTEVYELIEHQERISQEDEEARKTFWSAVILTREGKMEEALEIFSQLRARYPNDRPVQYFIERAQGVLVHQRPATTSRGKNKESLDAQLMRGHARILQGL